MRFVVGARDRIVAERGKKARLRIAREQLERLQIEMIVMVVRHQYSVDSRQLVEIDARRIDTLRPGPLKGLARWTRQDLSARSAPGSGSGGWRGRCS